MVAKSHIHVYTLILVIFEGREKIHQITEEERALKEENIRLQRRLLRETERREQLSRQLSESESSLEMEDERCVRERCCTKFVNPEFLDIVHVIIPGQ